MGNYPKKGKCFPLPCFHWKGVQGRVFFDNHSQWEGNDFFVVQCMVQCAYKSKENFDYLLLCITIYQVLRYLLFHIVIYKSDKVLTTYDLVRACVPVWSKQWSLMFIYSSKHIFIVYQIFRSLPGENDNLTGSYPLDHCKMMCGHKGTSPARGPVSCN